MTALFRGWFRSCPNCKARYDFRNQSLDNQVNYPNAECYRCQYKFCLTCTSSLNVSEHRVLPCVDTCWVGATHQSYSVGWNVLFKIGILIIAPFAILLTTIFLPFFYVFACWNPSDDSSNSNMFRGLEFPAVFSIVRIAYCFSCGNETCFWFMLLPASVISVCIVLPIYICLFLIFGVLLQLGLPLLWFAYGRLIIRELYNTLK